MDNGKSFTSYNYKDYDEYIRLQKSRAAKTKESTRKHIGRREWIYSQMIENGIDGDSILCLGARHRDELDFFKEKGYETVDGIDLLKSDGIIECDMSKIYEHTYFDNKKYDVVLSCESLEHCLDFEGFIRSLNIVCSEFFVCIGPAVKVVNAWDCSRHSYMNNVRNDELFKKDLLESFPEFNIVFNMYNPSNNRIFFILRKK